MSLTYGDNDRPGRDHLETSSIFKPLLQELGRLRIRDELTADQHARILRHLSSVLDILNERSPTESGRALPLTDVRMTLEVRIPDYGPYVESHICERCLSSEADRGCKIPLSQIPKYEGASGVLEVEEWIYDISQLLSAHKAKDEEIVGRLHMILHGTARSWYLWHVDDDKRLKTTTWNEWANLFRSFWGSVDAEIRLEVRARNRILGYDEDVLSYYHEKLRRLNIAYPDRSDKDYAIDILGGLPTLFQAAAHLGLSGGLSALRDQLVENKELLRVWTWSNQDRVRPPKPASAKEGRARRQATNNLRRPCRFCNQWHWDRDHARMTGQPPAAVHDKSQLGAVVV